NQIFLHIPDKKASPNNINPLEDIRTRVLRPNAVLAYQPGFEDLIIVPLDFAKDLLNEHDQISAIELYAGNNNSSRFKREIQDILGKDFIVKNREQQIQILYKTVSSEK